MSETALLKDGQWSAIDGELCLVTDFRPMPGNKVENGVAINSNTDMPYASVSFKCRKASEEITGFITHKIDFQNLWAIFNERGVGEDEEMLMYWTRKHYKNAVSRFLSAVSPKVIVLICKKGTYKSVRESFPLQSDPVMVHVYALEAIDWLVPDVIK